MFKVLIAAGGTGGHIYPAIAIANEMVRLRGDTKVLFIGAEGKMEEKIVPANGYELVKLRISGFKRKINISNIKVIYQFIKAVKEAKKILESYQPNVVFGTGGYVSAPVIWAASNQKYPTVVLEGNYYPGLAVKFLASKIDKLILNFSETKKYLKKKNNVEIMSYPVRADAQRIERVKALEFFNLENKKTIFVFGGSQGAGSVNNVLLKIYNELLNGGIQIIWQTGNKDFDKVNGAIGSKIGIRVLNYIDNIELAYSAADLVICRAGISSVMEAAKFGLAVIFVPYSLAAENHQLKNAEALVKTNSAEMILDSELDEQLFSKITGLISDTSRLKMLRDNIQKYSEKDAALKIAKLLFKMGKIVLSDG